MQAYLVGGYVRDHEINRLLGKSIIAKDRDWVVVGSTEKEMLKQGFHRVGQFPVFLHPQNKEEWALARTEKKTDVGYKGFEVDFNPNVTLEEDLGRRDLTINAMAQDPNTGQIIDPYHGKADIQNKILRHISPAFIEDPLRVLRVARFAARFDDFTIAPETMTEMQRIVAAGELAYLTPERVWKEIHSALGEARPEIFFNVLRKCHALAIIWPELNALWDPTAPVKSLATISDGPHTMMVLQHTAQQSPQIPIRFAVLCHALSTRETPLSGQAHPPANAELAPLQATCERFKVPSEYKQLALKVGRLQVASLAALALTPNKMLHLFNQLDVWRKPQEFAEALVAYEYANQSPLGTEQNGGLPVRLLRLAADECTQVNAQKFIEKGIQGKHIKEAIENERARIIQTILTTVKTSPSNA
ncbi:MAG: multifunctional CCA addition/repair protein [Ferrimonas sp.]